MNRPILIGVELTPFTDEHGTRMVPDLGNKIREHVTQTGPDTFVVSWEEHAAVLHRIGRFAGQLWFFASATPGVLTALAHLGANIKLVRDLTQTQRQAILDMGFRPVRRVSDDAIVGIAPPTVLFGDDHIAVALDGQLEEDEEYYIP